MPRRQLEMPVRTRPSVPPDYRPANHLVTEKLTLLETVMSNAPIGCGFVDLNLRIVLLNEKLAAITGSSVAELIGQLVFQVLPDIWPTLEPLYRQVLTTGEAVLDIDIEAPSAEDPGHPHYWLLNLYPVTAEARIIGIGVIAVDISERKLAELARVKLTRAAVDTAAAAIEARDPYTAGHQKSVAIIASTIAVEMGLDANEIEGIDLAARIHDLGKLRVPAEILTRPGPLLPEERELIKIHPIVGAELIKGIDFGSPVAEMIAQHHERLDGSGYPHGLHGDEICLGARIIAIADTADAMASARPYRRELGAEAAVAEIVRQRGSLYDPVVVDTFVRLVNEGRVDLGTDREDRLLR
jgi:PAS domain S-box-containing protein/putative nucleotidyltransferase with HDIG domain